MKPGDFDQEASGDSIRRAPGLNDGEEGRAFRLFGLPDDGGEEGLLDAAMAARSSTS